MANELASLGMLTGGFLAFIIIAMIWSSIWKGIALWKAGRNNQITWFIVMFIVNTLGILEIVYLVWFQKKKR